MRGQERGGDRWVFTCTEVDGGISRRGGIRDEEEEEEGSISVAAGVGSCVKIWSHRGATCSGLSSAFHLPCNDVCWLSGWVVEMMRQLTLSAHAIREAEQGESGEEENSNR